MRCVSGDQSGMMEMTKRDEIEFWLSTAVWCLSPFVVGMALYVSEGDIQFAVVSAIFMGGLVVFRLRIELPNEVSRIDFDEGRVTLCMYLSRHVVQLPYQQIAAIQSFDYATTTRYSIHEKGGHRRWEFHAGTPEEDRAFATIIRLWENCKLTPGNEAEPPKVEGV